MKIFRETLISALILITFFSAFCQSEALHYSVNQKFPRYATELDKILLSEKLSQPRDVDFPAVPVCAVAEFEPMQAVMVAYPLGVPVSLVRELSKITQVNVLVSTAGDSVQASSYFSQSQVNMSNIRFWRVPHDSYWVRDYGPWFIIDGNDSVGVVDFTYNRPARQKDDAAMDYFVNYLNVRKYEMNMVHTGGNYMVDGYGTAASTMLVEHENPNETAESLQMMAQNHLGIDNYMFLPDPLGEYIAHIDCWGKFLAVDKVLIAKVPTSDPRYDNYEDVAETFAQAETPWGNHYQVFRVNENLDSYQPTPYTNSLIINDHVFVPVAGNSLDNEAVEVYEKAMPGYTIVPIMQSYYTPWWSTDALHCRTHEIADLGMLRIRHYPILGGKSLSDNLIATAQIKPLSGANLISDSLQVFYKINSQEWNSQMLTQTSEADFAFDFSSLDLNAGDTVRYYLRAKDESGRNEKHPYIGAPDPHIFTIDNVKINDYAKISAKIYPNPAVADISLCIDNPSEVQNITISDLLGRTAITVKEISSNITKINVSDLSSGIYIIDIKTKSNQSKRIKFLKR